MVSLGTPVVDQAASPAGGRSSPQASPDVRLGSPLSRRTPETPSDSGSPSRRASPATGAKEGSRPRSCLHRASVVSVIPLILVDSIQSAPPLRAGELAPAAMASHPFRLPATSPPVPPPAGLRGHEPRSPQGAGNAGERTGGERSGGKHRRPLLVLRVRGSRAPFPTNFPEHPF